MTNLETEVRLAVARDPAARIARVALERAGGSVYAVGGVVRDVLLDITPNDVDLVVCGLAWLQVRDALESIPNCSVAFTGELFGVFRLRRDEGACEIAMPRAERSTGPGHRDFEVLAIPNIPIEQDLARRDFTVNAMAVPLTDEGYVIDPWGGITDVVTRRLRVLNATSFADDPLRIMRALVLRARFGLIPDTGTTAYLISAASHVNDLPADRVQAELYKLLIAEDPAAGLNLADCVGVLRHFLPEVAAAFGYDQNNPHHELDLGTHLLETLRRVSLLTGDPDVRLAALLHDIGKPISAWVDPETGSNHYYEGPNGEGADHAAVGAQLAYFRLRQLRWPADRINRVTSLIRHHMFAEFVTPKGARRFLANTGELADDLLLLREADEGAHSGQVSGTPLMRDLVAQVREAQSAVKRSDLVVRGSDVLAAGVPPSPRVGEILDFLLKVVIDDPTLNNRPYLLAEIRRLA